MNYDATIRDLTEKRDFYDAAISALKKIAVHDTAKAEAPPELRKVGSGRGKWTPEQRAAASERLKARWASKQEPDANVSDANGNGAQPHSDAIQ